MKKIFMFSVLCVMICLFGGCSQGGIQPLEVPSKNIKTKTYSNDQFSFEYPSKLNLEEYNSSILVYYSGREEKPIQIVVNNNEKNFNLFALKKDVLKNARNIATTLNTFEVSVDAEIASISAGNVLVIYTNVNQGILDGSDEIHIFLPDKKNKRSINFIVETDATNHESQKEALLVVANSFRFNEESN